MPIKFNFPNRLTPESDKHLISPYHSIPKSNRKFMRIKEISPTKETIDYLKISLYQHLRECIVNSMENMHTDVKV